jgi:RimJ/RimL family protein N-acetyltransferase
MMFRTDRLLLRRWRQSDHVPFAAINADATAMRYMRSCLTHVESGRWIERIEAEFERDGFGLWALERVSDGSFIGFTGLNRYPFEASFAPAVEIGWRLAPSFWGHGYATEAAIAALELGFVKYRLPEIIAETAVTNLPSRNVMSRIGMRHDPISDFMHPNLPNDHPLGPHVLYRASAPERAQG